MLVKLFRSPKNATARSGIAAIDYLLNERVEQGTSRILRGDEALTRGIISHIEAKNKATCFCLSFEEANITEVTKDEILDSFFDNMFPSLEGRYNSLVVEHTDKGRLELNIVVPNIDTKSDTPWTPYFHAKDKYRCDNWTRKINLTYGLSDPHDPRKKTTLPKDKTLAPNEQMSFEKLDQTLHELVADEQIQSRDQMIQLLEQHNFKINRKGEDYITIQLPNSKKKQRFKGGIYNERFGTDRTFEEIVREKAEANQRYVSRNDEKYAREISERLDEAKQHAARANIERCRKNDARSEKKRQQQIEPSFVLARDGLGDSDRLGNAFAENLSERAGIGIVDNIQPNNNDLHSRATDTDRLQNLRQNQIQDLNDDDKSKDDISEALRTIRAADEAIKRTNAAARESINRIQRTTNAIRLSEVAIRKIIESIKQKANSFSKLLGNLFNTSKSSEATIAPKDISEPTPTTQNAPKQSQDDLDVSYIERDGVKILRDENQISLFQKLRREQDRRNKPMPPTPPPTQTKQQPKIKPGIDHGRE